MKVALCIIATGKYTRFLCELLGTVRRFFCPDHGVRIFLFTDTEVDVRRHQDCELRQFLVPHEPWPGPNAAPLPHDAPGGKGIARLRLCLLRGR